YLPTYVIRLRHSAGNDLELQAAQLPEDWNGASQELERPEPIAADRGVDLHLILRVKRDSVVGAEVLLLAFALPLGCDYHNQARGRRGGGGEAEEPLQRTPSLIGRLGALNLGPEELRLVELLPE